MSRRKKRKVLIAVLVIAAALVVVFWGWSSTGGQNYLSVSEISNAPTLYAGKTIDVKGVVTGWNGDPGSRNFTLSDVGDPASGQISVTMTGSLPSGFENGKTVAAKGQLDSANPIHMQATDLTIGCASKY